MENDINENVEGLGVNLDVQETSSNEEVVSGKTDIEKVIRHINTVEVLNHAMWLLLQEKGFTHEDLNKKIEQVLEDQKKISSAKIDIKCSVCNQKMQVSGKFLAKCIYCGTVNSFNPYQLEVDSKPNATEETLEIHHVPEETFEPYDVDKDLNFDSEM
ncbi:MAG: hypothetical protein MJ153_04205 [Clostridia bacterium]|nr:hypothetical protein [Clostridia bacterium]